jgi:hypothetical protein
MTVGVAVAAAVARVDRAIEDLLGTDTILTKSVAVDQKTIKAAQPVGDPLE